MGGGKGGLNKPDTPRGQAVVMRQAKWLAIHDGREAIPDPQELVALTRPSLWHRLRILAGALHASGKVRFILVFLLFIAVAALLMMALEGRTEGSPFADLFKALWFTVVTITTVGYGDISPSSVPAQVLSMVIMLVGIGLVGIITGSVASGLVESNRKRALGLVPLKHHHNHIVVCGWKQDIRNILLDLLNANRWLTAYDLVLVTSHQPNEVGELKRDRRLQGLHFVFGNHTEHSVLEMARVDQAERVIILADESGRSGQGDPDSRTVLAATAVEAISQVVYTCTEIIRPHFVPYLRPAGVEEVVLGEQNARALISAASLGDGISNVADKFLPMFGSQIQVLNIPARYMGGSYEILDRDCRTRGYLPIGLLENTGRLHDRKKELVREAMKRPDYRQAVNALHASAHLTSNVPRLHPAADTPVAHHAKLLVLLPPATTQRPEEAAQRREEQPHGRFEPDEHLVICGWKPGMATLASGILQAHRTAGKKLKNITVVARMPEEEAAGLTGGKGLSRVKLVEGDPTDPRVLEGAAIGSASRALVLIDPVVERNPQEADARSVMISFAINELNPSAYKSVELLNPGLSDHLRTASVEETIYTRAYQRMMLVQATLGTGLSSAVGALFAQPDPVLQVRAFPRIAPGTEFGEYAGHFAAEGLLLIGSIEHSGNDYTRRNDYLRMAQSQPRIATAIEHLLELKTIIGNEALLNPGDSFVPGAESLAVVIASPHPVGQSA